jgi:ABC-type Fe3+-hydroxamate transport system substrate-binding protein
MKVTDQIGRELEFHRVPKRIISVVPSQTEYLYDLGLSEHIVGQTIFCVHPEYAFKAAIKVGGTKRLHIEKILELKPDIVIANKEENEKEQIETLQKELPVWTSDIKTLDDALNMMLQLGAILDKNKKAIEITDRIRQGFNTIETIATPKKALYLIWRQPWMGVGMDTFVHHMLGYYGLQNAVQVPGSRYPEFTVEEMVNLDPDVVLLSSEPYPFKQEHISELETLLPRARIELVDGELFSWYGSRLLKSVDYFHKIRGLLS